MCATAEWQQKSVYSITITQTVMQEATTTAQSMLIPARAPLKKTMTYPPWLMTFTQLISGKLRSLSSNFHRGRKCQDLSKYILNPKIASACTYACVSCVMRNFLQERWTPTQSPSFSLSRASFMWGWYIPAPRVMGMHLPAAKDRTKNVKGSCFSKHGNMWT